MGFSAEHLTKSFYGTTVLKDVSFQIGTGEIVALLGQNGSGKSTLIKVLTGFHAPDDNSRASLLLDGQRHSLPLADPDRVKFMIGAVHQDLGLCSSASVAENLVIAPSRGRDLRPLRWGRVYSEARALLERVTVRDVEPRAIVRDLTPMQQASVAVARAIGQVDKGGLLILDEVTAFLAQDAVSELCDLVKEIAASGVSVLFVSHRLEEIWRLCTRALVLRDGELVADIDLAGSSNQELIDAIVGQPLGWLYPDKQDTRRDIRLRLEIEPNNVAAGLQFEARTGEIVGATGLRGMGYRRLLRALYGVSRETGTLEVDGKVVDLSGLNPSLAYQLGVRLVPSDRMKNAAFGMGSVRENATLPVIEQFVRRGLLRRSIECDWVDGLIANYGIVPRNRDAIFGSLSGGNQQKVVVGHWLETEPKVLLLDEPVEGVDVGARRDIFERIVQVAKRGVTIIFSSTEAEDLAEMCHRVLVFRNGTVAGELEGSAVNEYEISRLSWTVTAGTSGDNV
jgi:ribose transport system ATP-binding protein